MASLERLLGTRLFDRGKVVEPTPTGRALLARAREALEARRRAIDEALAAAGTLAGELLVGASNVPSLYLLPPRIASFRARHPEVRVRLRTGDSRNTLVLLREGAFEVAAVGRRADDPTLEGSRFAEDRIVLVAPRGHPLLARAPVRPDDLRRYPFVSRERGSGTAAAAAAALRRSGLDPAADLDVVLETDSNEGVREAVAAGVGLGFLSVLALADSNGRVVPLPVKGFEARRAFWIVRRRRRTLSPAARAFFEENAPRRLR